MRKIIINILIILGISFLILTCIDNNKTTNPLTPEELSLQYSQFRDSIISDESNSVITLERTACFGTCPIYTVAIYENGDVRYFGSNFVKENGIFNSKISKDQTIFLLNYAINNKYLELNDEYITKIDTTNDGEIIVISISDMPSKITSIKYEGLRKKVNNYFGGPEWLSTFETKIDSIINVKKWVDY